VIPFRSIRFLVVVPKRAAIPLRVSPATTLYVVLGAEAEAGAAGATALEVPEMVRIWPIRIEFALTIEFRLIKFLVVVPNLAAMPLRVSPATTVYLLVPLAFGSAEVAGAGSTGADAPAIVNTWPTLRRLASVIPFSDIRFLVVVPNLDAIPLRVSLETTV
jgi:hypothetical protein